MMENQSNLGGKRKKEEFSSSSEEWKPKKLREFEEKVKTKLLSPRYLRTKADPPLKPPA